MDRARNTVKVIYRIGSLSMKGQNTIEERHEAGYWEVDIAVSWQSKADLIIATERMSRMIKIGKL